MNEIIAKHANKIAEPLIVRKKNWDATHYNHKFHYRDKHGRIAVPMPRMQGAHQCENAALAIAMLRHQDAITIPETAIAAAMEWAHWPARLQRLDDGPLQKLQSNTQIWLDGGHNLIAGQALADHFNIHSNGGNAANMHLIIAMLSNKDPASIITPLIDHIKSITVLPIANHECHQATVFEKIAHQHNIGVMMSDSIHQALQKLHNIQSDDIILITGSLYLAGEVLAANNQCPD